MSSKTVSEVVNYLSKLIKNDSNLIDIFVKGEISNFHRYEKSGHCYFTLKDSNAQISCAMFSSFANKLTFNPKDGDKVEVLASASVYEASGQLQLIIKSMKIDGIGDLYRQYEELKNKLAKEGYFLDEHKKELTIEYPKKIAILVGDKSAAMSDIKRTLQRRWPICKADYYPCLVQGKEAPADIISKLKEVDKLNYEIIILARGGGSFEDLFCFNDEELVKTIYNLKTFIVTGVGHEQDFTLVDFVSDIRASTPTASIELITPDINDVLEEIEDYSSFLSTSINNIINNIKMDIDYLYSRLKTFASSFDVISKEVSNTKKQLTILIKNILTHYSNDLKNNINLLNAYSYENSLNRGFSLVLKNDKIISNKKDLKNNDDILIKMSNGDIKALVKGD